VLEAAPDAMVCVDSGGRIVLVNAEAERMFGYPREELAGQPVEILVPDAIKAARSSTR
jgi:PAS domain S-box-containing protein